MRRTGTFLAFSLLAASCGPSFQVVYESDVHFEHCYALDQSDVPGPLKRDCWRAWLRAYTYGQPRDRVDYASARFASLSPEEARLDHDGRTLASRSATPAVEAPVPTNAFAPPPNVASATAAPDSGAFSAEVALPHTPGEECVATCQQRWVACRTGCKNAACGACDSAYRGCVPACFVDAKHSAP